MAKFIPFYDSAQMLLPHEKQLSDHKPMWHWKRWFGRSDSTVPASPMQAPSPRPNMARRLSRKAIPGLPRPGTFKRQQSELRDNLEPTKSKPDERRALSVDRPRNDHSHNSSKDLEPTPPRISAPVLIGRSIDSGHDLDSDMVTQTADIGISADDDPGKPQNPPGPVYQEEEDTLEEELEKRWILNLSMHFRDRSNREKFFVTFAETPTLWRRVTISLDYRQASPNSLEEELQGTQFQREKSARIYEAIRESLPDIQFYDTVTNLKLQTEEDRLHVHVTEDIHEVIQYPSVMAISHLPCARFREDELVFDSHLSGFVYKVKVNGEVFIKKEIPGPDTVEEFLYEVNALYRLSGSDSVIQFGGVITDNGGNHLKGLLISFAEKGALIDVIYDGKGELPWPRRERWAKQIVQGLSEIHEGRDSHGILRMWTNFFSAGFVQGDFTLSNIVIDADDKAKIIDINRRGCPVGWEPPEVAALLESKQRISMYIGVKSDIFQLGMVLWAIAMEQDEPEIQPRPLTLASAPDEIPSYYRALVGICLSDDPRNRFHTTRLLSMFPDIHDSEDINQYVLALRPSPGREETEYIDPTTAVDRADIDNFRLSTSHPHESIGPDLSSGTHTYVNAPTDMSGEPYFFPTRGRSPPPQSTFDDTERPISQQGQGDGRIESNPEAVVESEDEGSEPRVISVSPSSHYLQEENPHAGFASDIIIDPGQDIEEPPTVTETDEAHCFSDLAGVGEHSTLEHSAIPQGINDDDLNERNATMIDEL
jgi:serine/threonine protein kinase